MGKNKSNKSRSGSQQHTAVASTPSTSASERARVATTIEDIEKLTPPEALALPAPPDVPAQLDYQQLKDAYTKAYKAERHFNGLVTELKAKVDAATLEALEWDEKLEGLEQRDREAKAREATLTADERKLAARKAEQEAELGRRGEALEAREKKVLAREREADAGFVARAEKAQLELEAELAALRGKRRQIVDGELDAERARVKQELEVARAQSAQVAAALDERERGLLVREQELTDARATLAKDRRRIALEVAELEGEREGLEAARERAVERGRAEVQSDIASLRRRLDASERLVQDRDATIRGFGTSDAASLVSENTALKAELAGVRGELSNRPTADEANLLRDRSARCEALERELGMARARVGEVELRLSQHHLKARELETQRDAVRSLEAQNGLLRRAQKELVQTYQETLEKVEGASAFPSLIELDRTCTTPPPDRASAVQLVELCKTAQAVMADSQRFGNDGARHYDLGTIRTFVAGLAAARLHVLQGMSGTGKTSLPIWFARAVLAGGGEAAENVATIAVQSGWRDRHDLMGHFNTFERRFYESEFLRALYRAQTPKHAGRPFFILLDELNLSHPEQYFADFLSALEQPEAGRSVGLMEGQMRGAPPKLLVDGRIKVPPNVWFIGTANQDETTKGVAPKTRDRSHIMDLATKQEVRDGLPAMQPVSLSLSHLERLFAEAKQTQGPDLSKARKRLDALAEPLASASLGISNRLERYLASFVPVYVACGGRWEDALDHAVATKVVYGVKDRYDLTPQQLKALHEALPSQQWPRASAVVADAQARR